MGKFLMKPKIDFVFKEVMADEKARIGFLSAMLQLKPEDIRATVLLDTDLPKAHESDKQSILDVRVLLNDNTDIGVEIQFVKQRNLWPDWSLLYLAKLYAEQYEKVQGCGKLKKCVGISILNFTHFEGSTKYHSHFQLCEDKRRVLFPDQLEVHAIELPKLPAELKDGDTILLWAKFINAEQEEEFQELAGKDEYVDSALHQLEIISQNPGMQTKI